MRKYADLKPDDFPTVNSTDFARWRQATVATQRKFMWLGLAYTIVNLIIFFTINSQYYLGVIQTIFLTFVPLLIGQLIVRKVLQHESNNIARQFSISEEMVERARSKAV